jgi:4a-hydroxytetrahydrobiopterin dehydratase
MIAMKLSKSDVDSRLGGLPGWSRQGEAIARQFTFKSFPDAIAFVTRLAFAAEAADHHPDLLISYRKVTVTWSTHSEGGLTEKDFDGAKQSEMMAQRLGSSPA